jgi:hypothetical protein
MYTHFRFEWVKRRVQAKVQCSAAQNRKGWQRVSVRLFEGLGIGERSPLSTNLEISNLKLERRVVVFLRDAQAVKASKSLLVVASEDYFFGQVCGTILGWRGGNLIGQGSWRLVDGRQATMLLAARNARYEGLGRGGGSGTPRDCGVVGKRCTVHLLKEAKKSAGKSARVVCVSVCDARQMATKVRSIKCLDIPAVHGAQCDARFQGNRMLGADRAERVCQKRRCWGRGPNDQMMPTRLSECGCRPRATEANSLQGSSLARRSKQKPAPSCPSHYSATGIVLVKHSSNVVDTIAKWIGFVLRTAAYSLCFFPQRR